MQRKLTRRPVSQLLDDRARAMRFAPTPSEAALWRLIRARRLGVQFRRQVCIGRFIADFAALEAHLVVEVDGGVHRQRARADARRDRVLGRMGFRVLRLDAELVLRELDVARQLIAAALRAVRTR